MPKDDLELDLTDLAGDVVEVDISSTADVTPLATKPKKPPTAPKPVKKTSVLEDAQAFGWICLPSTTEEGQLSVTIREVGEATNQEFYQWVNHVFPAAKASKHQPDDYNSVKVRLKCILQIAESYRVIREVMKKYGTTSFKLSKN